MRFESLKLFVRYDCVNMHSLKYGVILWSFFAVTSPVLAQVECSSINYAYKAGETITYKVAYNWGFLWVNAGEAVFKIRSMKVDGKNAFYFYANGTSLKKWDWVYKVRDTYESFTDMDALRPLRFRRNTLEGKYSVNNDYKFDYEKGKVYTATENSNKPYSKDTISLAPCTFDVLSMIYEARNIDYSQYRKNDKIPISLIIDGKIYNLYIRYMGKDVLKTRDKEVYKCVKFKPMLVEGSLFLAGENMTVWVTDDQNRVPVLIEAKILVGSIKAYLSQMSGLKNSVTSRIH